MRSRNWSPDSLSILEYALLQLLQRDDSHFSPTELAQSICTPRQQLSFPEAAGRELRSQSWRSSCNPWAAKEGCAHQIVPDARDATCEIAKELSKIEPGIKKPCNRIVTMTLYHKPILISALLKAMRCSQGMLLITGQKSCRDHPEIPVFWFQKSNCFLQIAEAKEA